MHNRELPHIVKTDSLSKNLLFDENTAQKLDLRL